MKIITAKQASDAAAEARIQLRCAAIVEIRRLEEFEPTLHLALSRVFDAVSERANSSGEVVVELAVSSLFSEPPRQAQVEKMMILLRTLGYDSVFLPYDQPKIAVGWSGSRR